MKIQPHNIDKFRDRADDKRRTKRKFRLTEKSFSGN